jgi:hypothetical protein
MEGVNGRTEVSSGGTIYSFPFPDDAGNTEIGEQPDRRGRVRLVLRGLATEHIRLIEMGK